MHEHEESNKLKYLFSILGIIIFIISLFFEDISYYKYICYLSYLLISYDILFNAIKGILNKRVFDENFLMAIATIGALYLGEYVESILVILLYKIGEFLEDLAVDKSKEKIDKLTNLSVNTANLKNGDKVTVINVLDIKVGDCLIIKNGEKIPVDGIVSKGNSILDTSIITGESKPLAVNINDEVTSGYINLESVIEIKASKDYNSSIISEINKLITSAGKNKSETEKFITKFSKVYTPIVCIIAILLLIILPTIFNISFYEALKRALIFLVVSCPCALVISVPLSYFIAIGESSRNGFLVKGSNYLDILTKVKIVAFDKTGTLTNGKFEVISVESVDKNSIYDIEEYIAIAESLSNHYIAKSITKYYGKKIDKSIITEYTEIPGKGIKCKINDDNVLVGSFNLLKENNINVVENNHFGTIIYLSINNIYIGNIVLSDTIRESSDKIDYNLKKCGVTHTYILTGDKKEIADEFGKKLNILNVFSELLPKDKYDIIQKLKKNNKILYVGDGINDSPSLALADVSIAMGNGSDIAKETADIVMVTEQISKLIVIFSIAKETKNIVIQNIIFAIFVKLLFLILSTFGITNMLLAVFADVGVTLIVILNSLRLIKKRKV